MLITPTLITEIEQDEYKFCTFFSEYAEKALQPANLFPKLSKPRLVDIHGAWRADMKRVGDHEKALTDGLDHFKRGAHLAFWVRRFTPLIEAYDNRDNLADAEGYDQSALESAYRDLLFGYGNEYLAFDIGYQFSLYYETSVDSPTARATNMKLTAEYIGMVCHLLKYKTVSPHSLSVIYKSLFLE